MQALSQLLDALQLEANVFHNGQYCGMWAVDTSGSKQMTFHVVTHGACYLHVADQWLELAAGDAVFLPSDAKHCISNTKDLQTEPNEEESLSFEHLHADGTGLVCGYFSNANPIFTKLANQLPAYLVIRHNDGEAASKIIDLLLAESKSSGQSTNLLLNRLSDCLLYILLRDRPESERGLFAALAHPKLAKSLELIHQEDSARASVDELAAAAGMSRSAYAALFKTLLGESPADYQTQWRMTKAWRWLAADGESTLSVALRCGYQSEASFSKAFKRVMGVGPGKVRRS